MIDLKTLKSALEQLAEERGISQDQILKAVEDALTAAYKKEYGKKGQIIRAKFDPDSGKVEFYQVKIAVDPAMIVATEAEDNTPNPEALEEGKIRFNEEQHIILEDAKKIKHDIQVNEELIFPLTPQEDYGRIAAQTAKQVIIQRIREAERSSILDEYAHKAGQIVSGKIQKIERGNVFVDLGRVTGLLGREDQVPGEFYRPGDRIKCYLAAVEDTIRGVNLRLSRAHPQFVEQLFAIEVPEITHGTVVIKAIAREAGSRTKIAVTATDPHIDPVGSCVGQRGVRVNTVINELGGEKIDIIEWSPDPDTFINNALSPAKINKVELRPDDKQAKITVPDDQFSLAVGRGGQNARLAARLTGWKIDIQSPEQPPTAEPKPADSQTETNQVESTKI